MWLANNFFGEYVELFCFKAFHLVYCNCSDPVVTSPSCLPFIWDVVTI